jgi:glutamate-1-semialdehyde aminotransferase
VAASANTLVVEFNDLGAVKTLFEQFPNEIAGVIVEPIAANMGFIMPKPGYLHGLQELCRRHGALFILDEVMTGFRAALGGAQAHWKVDPDITCLGKVIGGGLPVGAYAGKRDIEDGCTFWSDVSGRDIIWQSTGDDGGIATIRALFGQACLMPSQSAYELIAESSRSGSSWYSIRCKC